MSDVDKLAALIALTVCCAVAIVLAVIILAPGVFGVLIILALLAVIFRKMFDAAKKAILDDPDHQEILEVYRERLDTMRNRFKAWWRGDSRNGF